MTFIMVDDCRRKHGVLVASINKIVPNRSIGDDTLATVGACTQPGLDCVKKDDGAVLSCSFH